ncbi:hypothetical protein ABEB36_009484 [Hypothenemus hampei]|uniref:Uncharacterized protein n=1 Tax=Hypothenemus hampei TaxID=57062 RepID=A0ABD1EJG5_HYPHA
MVKGLSSKFQEMVISLITFFERERDNNGPFLPLTAVRDRVAVAFNLSISTIHNISSKSNKGEIIRSPLKRHKRAKPVVDIDDFDQIAIRNVIYEMCRNMEFEVIIRKLFTYCRDIKVDYMIIILRFSIDFSLN